MFNAIETQTYAGTAEQNFLLLYRPLAMEVYLKRANMRFAEALREHEVPAEFTQANAAGVGLGLREIEAYKEHADSILMSKNYEDASHYVVRFDKSPQVLCTTWTSVEFGFQGQIVQDLSDPHVSAWGVAFTMLPIPSGGIAIFSWLNDSSAARRFQRSLTRIPDDRLSDLLIAFAFEYSENCHWQPSWWKGLQAPTRRSLERRFPSGTIRQPRRRGSLVDEEIVGAASWRVVDRCFTGA